MSDTVAAAPAATPVAPAAATPAAVTATPPAVAAPKMDAATANAVAKQAVAEIEKGNKAEPAKEAKDAKAEAPPVEAPKAKRKVKVDDAEIEVDDDELVRGYQTAKAADKRFREAAQAKKEAVEYRAQASQVLDLMQKDPLEFARRAEAMGIKTAEFAEAILRPLIEQQMFEEQKKEMSAEQLKQLELEQKLAQYEKREAAQKKAADEAEAAKQSASKKAEVERHTNEMSLVIMGALKETKLPQTHETAMDMVSLLQEAIERGIPVDAKTLARDLESRKREELRAVATPDMLSEEVRAMIRREALNDPALREEIRKASVEEFKKNNPMVTSKPVTGPSSDKKDAPVKRSTFSTVARELMLASSKRG